jgi:hypothetical protein
MRPSMATLDRDSAWAAIETYRLKRLGELFRDDPGRLGLLGRDVAGIRFDWSKTHLDPQLVDAFPGMLRHQPCLIMEARDIAIA